MLFTALCSVLKGFFVFGYTQGESFKAPLSREEEAHYLDEFAKGSKEAQNVLIERNMRLVAHNAKKFHTSPVDRDDLISIGTIGLIKAILSFKPAKNVRLSTYASRCIDNEILMHLRSIKKENQEVFLQEPQGQDSEGNQVTIEEKLEDRDVSIEEAVAFNMESCAMYKEIDRILSDRERLIITLRYGLDGEREHTQREIGKLLNISRSYVSRIEKKALEKIKKGLEPA